jgi:PqqD family protein of HPr-rel-A system
MRWQLRNGQSLSMLAGEDESVVYNDQSGETHLLSAIAISLLQHLQHAPDDLSGICNSLSADWEFDADTELHRLVLTLADELDGLSFIEPCLP